jgi:hypothetical protein
MLSTNRARRAAKGELLSSNIYALCLVVTFTIAVTHAHINNSINAVEMKALRN